MRQGRALQFEALETRKLLSKAHHAVAHTAPAVVKLPLALDGTLAVNESAVTTSMNVDGSSTTSAPVSGRLGALGDIHGVWEESVGALGEADGPDTIRLHDSKGTVIIAFNNQTPGKAHPIARGTYYFQHAQRISLGTGAYTGATESGTIEVITSAARKQVESLTLKSQNP